MVVISTIGVANDETEIDGALSSERRLPIGDERHVERGAAEISGDHIANPGRMSTIRTGRDHPGCRSRSARCGLVASSPWQRFITPPFD